MMELNSQTNVFTNGLDMDSDVAVLGEGKYRYAENIRFNTNANGTTGALQNIEHVRKYTIGIPNDEIILGTSNTRLYDIDKKQNYEVGVVVTKKYVNGLVYNTLYVVQGFDSVDLETLPVVKGYLEIENNVNIVTNYESNNVSNVYITDGNSPIKVINIEEQLRLIRSNGLQEVSDPTRFDITPGSVLIPFHYINTVNGVLPAGAVQYAYQLFNMNGGETPVSALSEVIPIVNQSASSKSAKGGIKKDITDMGCQIKASFMNDGRFDRMRIYSIVYLDNISIPNIYIANEVKVPSSKEYEFIECTYTDSGNGYLSQITIDEFNAMTPYEFTATSIEKMQNRLFASNIQELTWDVDFDARAYRCDQYGIIKLDSGSGDYIHGVLKPNGKIYDMTGTYELKVPEEHDCINPSNVNLLDNDSTYTYGVDLSGIRFRGGSGPNVSYKFTYTRIELSQQTSISITNSVNFDASKKVNKLTSVYEDNSQAHITATPDSVIPNYADPYMCANFLGYQRDEIYRFGIIFYNNKGIPSPVHWIGDIKMPATYYTSDTSSKIYPFHCGDNATELAAYVLGLEFTVKNIPENVYAYEIVRCDRTSQDRTVVCQGALGATVKMDPDDYSDWIYGDTDTRFLTSLMLPKKTINMGGFWDGKARWRPQSIREDCFEFASPEVCISGDSVIGMIKNAYLHPLYHATSYTGNNDGRRRVAAYPTNVTMPDGEISQNPYKMFTDYQAGLTTYRDSDDNSLYYTIGKDDANGHTPRCAVFKHYMLKSTNDLVSKKPLKIDEADITKMIPYQRKTEELRNYVQPFGEYSIINSAFHIEHFFPNHGISGILIVKNFDSFIPLSKVTTDTMPETNEFNTTAICNIKRNILPYNGNGYVNRQTSIYQSCGCFQSADKEAQPVLCFGGDTYLCIFDYQNTVFAQESNDYNESLNRHICHASYLPLETVINLNYRTNDSFNNLSTNNLGANFIQIEPIATAYYTQDEPIYGYNSVYSVQSGSKQYIPKSIYAEDNMLNQCRIVNSELKTNNETIDSWTKFKVANYLDVDTKFGPITNLKAFKNKLYYWQNSAVGIASVNERSLITDNNMAELTLGTGGILARFDYITEKNGSSITNDKSIVTSENYIYWYDFDKNVLCQLGQGINQLSKSGNVQSYLNSLHSESKKNAVSFYDNKYNEVWFRLYDKALIYNERLNVFTSFYTHNPNWFFPFSDKLVTIKDNNMYYLHNIYDVNSEDVEERISKIQFIVNKDITNTKVFDNVTFSADLVDNKNEIPNIIKDVTFRTKTQVTEPINFNDIDLREDNYRFAISREKVDDESMVQLSSKSYLGRMRGKYLICDYTFDCNNNREFKLPYIKTTYRYSML